MLLWYIWKARNDNRFNRKTWFILQVHLVARAELKDAREIEAQQQPVAISAATLDNAGPQMENRQTWYTEATTITTCFMDAAFPRQQETNSPHPAGLGILISGGDQATIKVPAHATRVISPLHAEALALLLASRITKAIRLQAAEYASDSQIMVNTLQRDNNHLHPAGWCLRPMLYEFKRNNDLINFKARKIPRSENQEAHNLAQLAAQATAQTAPS